MIEDDRYRDLLARSVQSAVFGPGAMWRKMGNNEVLRQIFGEDFPSIFIVVPIEPPDFGGSSSVWINEVHDGAHAFIEFRWWRQASDWSAEIKGVFAFCMLEANIREAALHLLETTRDANGALGGLKAKFRMGAAQMPTIKAMATTGVLEADLPRLLNAYQCWKVSSPAERANLADHRCPLCAVRLPAQR